MNQLKKVTILAIEVSEEVRCRNRKLCDRYPFLIPRNPWSGEVVPEYTYEYTELDEMPDGWRAAFGEQLCEELKQELLRAGGEDALNNYTVDQIKEKYGGLRWYSNGDTEKGYEIISKYEDISRRTCISCGKPATKISKGWISPFCDDCIGDTDYWPIDEYYDRGEAI